MKQEFHSCKTCGVQFLIEQAAVPLERARVARNGHVYTPERSRAWKELVATTCTAEMRKAGMFSPYEVPVALRLSFGVKVPASWSKRARDEALSGNNLPTSRPDLSNLVKAIEDAMNGIAYRDDSQIVQLYVWKIYTEEPGVAVHVAPLLLKEEVDAMMHKGASH